MYASVKCSMEGMDFYFPLIDEEDPASGLAYWRPRYEFAPERQGSKIMAGDEGRGFFYVMRQNQRPMITGISSM